MAGRSEVKGERRVSWLRVIGSLATLAILIYLISRQGWEDILAAVLEIEAWRFALALCVMLASRMAVAGRWHSLLHSAQAGISFPRSVQITFSGLFAGNFLPTTVGGDVVRVAAAIQSGSDEALSVASVVADRLIGLLGMATALPLGLASLLAYEPGAARGLEAKGRGGSWLAWIILSVGVRDLWEVVGRQFRRLVDALLFWRKRPAALLRSYIATWLHMICLFTAIRLILGGLGEPLAYREIAGLWSMTYFITLLPVSINGLGVQEVSMVLIFSELGGTSMGSSVTLSLLMRTLFVIASLPGALFLPTFLGGRDREEPSA